MSFNGTKAMLLLLSAYAVYALMIFASKNGTFDLVSKSSSSNVLLQSPFTHISSIDRSLGGLCAFFWPLIDGSNPGGSLHCFWFAGQGVALWTLTVMEGLRWGNRWRVSSFTTIFGLLFQAIGMAIAGPIFLFIHLTTSSTRFPQAEDLNIDLYHLQALPFSIAIGLIAPTILMSLPAPTYLSPLQKTNLVRLWQFFPVLSNLAQFLFSHILRYTSPAINISSGGKLAKLRLSAVRRAYVFGIVCSGLAHIATLGVSLSASFFPSLFGADVVRFLQPGYVFVPTSPFSSTKVSSIGEGAHWFLQWDDIIMCSAFLIWACAINSNVVRGGKSRLVNFVRFLAASLVVGPGGSAMLAMWETEEVVHSGLATPDKKHR